MGITGRTQPNTAEGAEAVKMDSSILVKFRNNDIAKALAEAEVFQGRGHAPFYLVNVIAVNQCGVQCPGQEVGEVVAQGNITNGSSGTSTADRHSTEGVFSFSLWRDIIFACTGFPASGTED